MSWIAEIVKSLNGGLLPEGYYALGEQVTTGGNPDLLALHQPQANGHQSGGDDGDEPGGGTALLTARPATRHVSRALPSMYPKLQRRVAIRHKSGDRVVALIEIVSSGNKAAEYPWQSFVDKMIDALNQGIHLLILDVYPPTRRDPGGVHGSVWGRLIDEDDLPPASADRTLVAYSAGPETVGYVEPVAVGQPLRPMPLFLTRDGQGYVEVPLEATYLAAYEGVPRRYRADLG